LPLIHLLEAYLDDAAAAELREAALSEHRVAVELVGTDSPLTLTLRPGPIGEFWRGTLRPAAADAVRIEGAVL
jgi:hypothetical protein